ncbi:MAG: DUF975 family protein [Bacteroidales bacterium]|nr:DUF975 family protein [Bacteroidales bacterium]
MKENFEIRAAARESLSGRWTTFVLTTLIFSIIVGAIDVISNFPAIRSGMYWSTVYHTSSSFYSVIGLLVSIFVLLPLSYGFALIFLRLVRNDDTLDPVTGLFYGFNDYGRAIAIQLLVGIYTFLWSLLLIIPGIIKAYSYSMSVFISYDNPELSTDDCINKSMAMMEGHKFDLFLLDLSFIGWGILALFTCGIGFLWLVPYIQTSHAVFYEELKLQETAQFAGTESRLGQFAKFE